MNFEKFPQANFVFGPPKGVSEQECGSLPVWRGNEEGTNWPVIISAWRPSAEELAEINRTGLIWLRIYGQGMQPVSMSGFSPWPEPKKDEDVEVVFEPSRENDFVRDVKNLLACSFNLIGVIESKQWERLESKTWALKDAYTRVKEKNDAIDKHREAFNKAIVRTKPEAQ